MKGTILRPCHLPGAGLGTCFHLRGRRPQHSPWRGLHSWATLGPQAVPLASLCQPRLPLRPLHIYSSPSPWLALLGLHSALFTISTPGAPGKQDWNTLSAFPQSPMLPVPVSVQGAGEQPPCSATQSSALLGPIQGIRGTSEHRHGSGHGHGCRLWGSVPSFTSCHFLLSSFFCARHCAGDRWTKRPPILMGLVAWSVTQLIFSEHLNVLMFKPPHNFMRQILLLSPGEETEARGRSVT